MVDRFQRPNSREDAKLARQEVLASELESKISLLRKIKLEYNRAAEIMVDGYIKTLDPDGTTFVEQDVADLTDSIKEVLAGPYFELISALEKKFEDDVAES